MSDKDYVDGWFDWTKSNFIRNMCRQTDIDFIGYTDIEPLRKPTELLKESARRSITALRSRPRPRLP